MRAQPQPGAPQSAIQLINNEILTVMSEREEYLRNLAADYGVPASFVFELAYILGESEDFDGLIVCLDDIACRQEIEI